MGYWTECVDGVTVAGALPTYCHTANATSAASSVVKPMIGNNHRQSNHPSQRRTIRRRATDKPRRVEAASAATRNASVVTTSLSSPTVLPIYLITAGLGLAWLGLATRSSVAFKSAPLTCNWPYRIWPDTTDLACKSTLPPLASIVPL